MRKVLPLLTLALLSAASAQEALKLPIVKSPLSLTYWQAFDGQAISAIKNSSEILAMQEFEKKTGINIDFIHPPLEGAAASERFNLMLVSRDYPDVIEVNWLGEYPGGPAKALKDGVIIPLNDLVAKYAPNFSAFMKKNPELRRQFTTDDGLIYSFPFLRIDPRQSVYWGPMIRQDWLTKLKLQQPVSIDSWYRTLKAFKTKDPNGNGKADEIPFTNGARCSSNSFCELDGAFMGAFGIANGFYRKDGKIAFGYLEPGYRNYMTTMNKWYKEGLIDPDYTSNSQQQADAKILNSIAGAYSGLGGGNLGRYNSTATLKGFLMVPVRYPAGPGGLAAHNLHPAANKIFGGQGAAISSKNKHVVETVKMLDYGYSREGSLILNFGKAGQTYNMVKGQPVYTDLILKNPKLSLAQAVAVYTRARSAPMVQDVRYTLQTFAPGQPVPNVVWAKASREYLLPPIGVDAADSSRYASIMNDVGTYIAEMQAKFIDGREPLSNLPKFQATLRSMGIDDAVKIMQRALESYNKR